MFLYELILREGKEKYSTSGLVGDGLLALIAGGVTGKIVLLIMTHISRARPHICISNKIYWFLLIQEL